MATVLIRMDPTEPKAGEQVDIRVVVLHPMEPGTIRDADGNLIPANHINDFRVYFNEETLATGDVGGGVSANPLFSFKMTAKESGTVRVWFKDMTGEVGDQTAQLNVV